MIQPNNGVKWSKKYKQILGGAKIWKIVNFEKYLTLKLCNEGKIGGKEPKEAQKSSKEIPGDPTVTQGDSNVT